MIDYVATEDLDTRGRRFLFGIRKHLHIERYNRSKIGILRLYNRRLDNVPSGNVTDVRYSHGHVSRCERGCQRFQRAESVGLDNNPYPVRRNLNSFNFFPYPLLGHRFLLRTAHYVQWRTGQCLVQSWCSNLYSSCGVHIFYVRELVSGIPYLVACFRQEKGPYSSVDQAFLASKKDLIIHLQSSIIDDSVYRRS